MAGRALMLGHKVRIKPRPGGDILDRHLAGRSAVIENIEEDDTGTFHVAVTVEGSCGSDLAAVRHPAHRFLLRLDEIEPSGGFRHSWP